MLLILSDTQKAFQKVYLETGFCWYLHVLPDEPREVAVLAIITKPFVSFLPNIPQPRATPVKTALDILLAIPLSAGL